MGVGENEVLMSDDHSPRAFGVQSMLGYQQVLLKTDTTKVAVTQGSSRSAASVFREACGNKAKQLLLL